MDTINNPKLKRLLEKLTIKVNLLTREQRIEAVGRFLLLVEVAIDNGSLIRVSQSDYDKTVDYLESLAK